MANSINIVHEMINKVGFEFDDATAKKVVKLAENAGKLAASGMSSEASVGFQQISELFNKELAKLGKQKIDFSKMIATPNSSTFENMFNTFISQISSGLVKSIDESMGEIEKQFSTLVTRRAQAVQQRDTLEKQYRIKNTEADKLDDLYTEVINMKDMKNVLPIDDKFVEKAHDALIAFSEIQEKLEIMEEKGKVNASTLQSWLNAAKELSMVYNAVSKADPIQQGKIGAQLGKPNMKYLLDGQFEEHIGFGGDVVDNFIDNNDIYESLTKAQQKVADLDSQIMQLTNKHPELIDKQKAIEAEELINRVQEAYERLFYKQGKNKGTINSRSIQDIESALNYVPKSSGVTQITDDMDVLQTSKIKAQATKAFEALDMLGNKYSESLGKNWEQQAQAAIKFVREYEAQMNHPQINQEMVEGWADTYKELKPMIAEYEAMLQNVVNIANGKELTDMSQIVSVNKDATNNAEQKRVADEASAKANARAKEEAEEKLRIEKEAIEVSRLATEEAEKERIAKEATAKAEEKANVDVESHNPSLDNNVSLERVEKAASQAEQAVESLNDALKEKDNLDDGGIADTTNENVKTQAIEKQNDALEENIKLQKQSDNIQVDTVNEDEIAGLDRLDQKVKDVISTVESKTQAFRDESDTVDTVVTSEVDSLERLDNKIVEIKNKFEALLTDIDTKQPTVNAPEITEQAFVAEGEAVERVIDKENQALKTLRENIETTVEMVNTKTKAFITEGTTVGQVIGKEVSGLIKLHTQVKEVNETILKLVGNLKNVKTAAKTDIKVKVENTEANKKSDAKTEETPQRSKSDMTQLEKMYQKLGVLYARLDDNNWSTQSAHIEVLEEEIKRKQESLGLTEKEIAALKEKMNIAEKAENRIIQGEKEQAKEKQAKAAQDEFERSVKDLESKSEKLGKLQAQAESGDLGKAEEAKQLDKIIQQETEKLGLHKDQNAEILKSIQLRQQEAKANQASVLAAKEQKKDEDKAWRDQVKAARGYNGVNVANSAVTAGNRTVTDVIGDASITSDIEAKARELQDAVKTLAALKDDVNRGINEGAEVDSDGLARQTKRVQELTEEMNNLMSIHKKYANAEDIKVDVDSFKNIGLDEYEKQLTSVAEASVKGKLANAKFNAETKELTGTVKTGANAFTTYSFAVDNVDGKLKKLNQGTKKTESFMEGVTRKTKELAQYAIGSISIYDIWNQIKQGVTYVREIDTAMTELKKVTDETEQTYDRFLDTASKTASKVGSTVKDIISSTADWSRLGYSIQEAHELAASTSVLLNVSEFDSVDSATSALISTMQAFEYEADRSMHVVDIMNEIGNNYAVSSDGIATALQDSASALAAANNSYQESVAMIAAANKTTQDVSKVGGALRTISLRLRGTEVEGEDNEGVITSKSKLQSTIKGLTGVDILTDTNAYRSTYEILLDISKVFNEMSDMDQAALLEIIAGKNRSNVAAGLLSNTQDLEDAYKSAMNAEGSAYAENEKYLDSIEGKIKRFQNALQTAWNNELQSEWIKGFIDAGTVIVELIDKIGLLQTAILGVFATVSLKNKQSMNESFFSLLGEIKTRGKAMTYGKDFVKEDSDIDTSETDTSGIDAETEAIKRNTAEKQKNAEVTKAGSVAEDQSTSDRLENASATEAETNNTKENTGAKIENANANQMSSATEDKDTQDTLENIGVTKTDTNTTKENTIANIENANSSKVAAQGEQADTNATIANVGATATDSSTTKANTAENIANAASNASNGVSKIADTAVKAGGTLLTLGKKLLGVVGKFLKSNWIILVITLLPTAIKLLKNFGSTEEDLVKQTAELKKEWNSLYSTISGHAKEFNSLKKSADELIPKYAKLAQGVDKFGKNVYLSAEEYDEFISLNDQLAEMFPELVVGYDENGNAMLSLAGDVDTLTESIKALVEAKRLEAAEDIANTMPDVMKNIRETSKLYEKESKKLSDTYLNPYNMVKHSFSDEAKQHYKNTYGDNWEEIWRRDANTQALNNIGGLQSLFDNADDWHEATKNYLLPDGMINWEEFINSAELKNALAGTEKQINDYSNRIESTWQQLNQVMSQWMVTNDNYNTMSSNAQDIAQKLVGSFDFSSIDYGWFHGDDTTQAQQYIEDNIIKPLKDAKPSVQEAIGSLFDLSGLFESGRLSVGEYKQVLDQMLAQLKEAGIGDETINAIKISLDIEDIETKITELRKYFTENEIGSLTSEELELAYRVVMKGEATSFEELKGKIEQMKIDLAPDINVWDFSDMINGLNKAKDSADDLITSMAKLASGTALTKSELAQLAFKYPELLQASNLFTDGSIQGQKDMLNSILDMTEQEYDAQIDAKIAELEATNQVLQQQLDVETEKANMLLQIEEDVANGKISSQEQLQKAIDAYYNREGQNYVSLKEGELQVNKEALDNQLAQGADFGKKSETNVWNPYQDLIIEANEKGYAGAAEATNSFGRFLSSAVTNMGSTLKSLGRYIKDVLDPTVDAGDISSYFTEAFYEGVTKNVGKASFKGGDAFVDDTPLSDWVDIQSKYNEEFRVQISDVMQQNLTVIDNLKNLKGLDLHEIYADGSSGGSGGGGDGGDDPKDTLEEKLSDFEQAQNSFERAMNDLNNQQTYIQNEIDRLVAAGENVSASYYEQLIGIEDKKLALYESQRGVLQGLLATQEEGTDEWYEIADAIWDVEFAIQESTTNIIKFRKEISKLYKTASEDISKAYGHKRQLFDDRTSYVENEIEMREDQGEIVPESAYRELLEQGQLKREDAKSEMQAQQALYDAGIEKNGAEWAETDEAIGILEIIRQKKLDIQDLDDQEAETLKKIAAQYLTISENISKAYGNLQGLFDDRTSWLENEVAIREANGEVIPSSVYKEMANQAGQRRQNAENERQAQVDLYWDGINNGKFTEGSEEAIAILDTIRNKTLDIQDASLEEIEALKQIAAQYLKISDTISEMYSNQHDLFGDRTSWLQNEIDIRKANGEIIPSSVYKEMAKQAKAGKDAAEQEMNAQVELYWTGINNGELKEGSKEALAILDKIRQKKLEGQQYTKQEIEYLKQIAAQYLEISKRISELYSNLQGLFSDRTSWIQTDIDIKKIKGEVVPSAAYREIANQARDAADAAFKEAASQTDVYNTGIDMGDFVETDETAIKLADTIRDKMNEGLQYTKQEAEALKQIAAQYLEIANNISKAHENQRDLFGDRQSIVETEISIRQTKGEVVPLSAYDELIEQEGFSQQAWKDEYNHQMDLYNIGMANGDFVDNPQAAFEILDKARNAYDKAAKSEENMTKWAEQRKDAYIEYIDKMLGAYKTATDFYKSQANSAQTYIDRLGILNINVPDEAYEKMAEIQDLSNAGMTDQLKFLYGELDNMVAEGIDKNDDRYIAKYKEAMQLEEDIQNGINDSLEYRQKIIENHLDRFNQVIDRINHTTSQLDNISGLVSNEDVANEDGSWTEAGLTQLGMLYHQMEYNKQVAEEYAYEMSYLDEQLTSGAISEKEYTEQMQALTDGQWDAINAYKSAEDAIVDLNESRIDMIEDGISKEMEAYQELIDLKKEELDAERDLYDFRNNIQKQTKDIAALERRIASMSGSTDAATIAERTKLSAELREAREGLNDSYYDHSMTSQSKALDDEMAAYEKSASQYLESLRESIKDTKTVVDNTFIEVMANADVVLGKMNELAETYGFVIDPNVKQAWNDASDSVIDFVAVVSSDDTKKNISSVFETGSLAAEGFSLAVGRHLGDVETLVNTFTSKDSEKYYGIGLKAPWKDAESAPLHWSEESQRYMTQEVVEYAEKWYKEQLREIISYPWDQDNDLLEWGKTVQDMLTLYAVGYAEQNYKDLLTTILNYPWDNANAHFAWGQEIQDIITQGVVEYTQNNYQEKLKEILDYPWENANGQVSWGADIQRVITQEVVEYTQNYYQEKLKEILNYPWEQANGQASWGEGIQKVLTQNVVEYAQNNYQEKLKEILDWPWDNATEYNTWGKGVQNVLEGVKNKAVDAGNALSNLSTMEVPSYFSGSQEGSQGGDNSTSNNNNSNNNNNNNATTTTTKPSTTITKPSGPSVTTLQTFLNEGFGAGLVKDGIYGTATTNAVKKAQKTVGAKQDGKYGQTTRDKIIAYWDKKAKEDRQHREWWEGSGNWKNRLPAAIYAKGTLGTTKDQFAITDESWIGEEITLAAGKNGQLQYLKKGSAVLPSEIATNLVEWGKLDPTMMSIGDMSGGIHMMSNYISKPELNVSFDSLVHVDHCDEGTLKDLEKMVDTKINQFSKQMNYAIKRFK